MRRCVFCDAEIPADAPPEHVVPKWLRKFTRKGEMFTHQPDTLRSWSAASGDERSTWGDHPLYPAKHPQLTVDTVCQSCNHHWMSDLETFASPILTPMIEGKRQGLDLERQLLLSRWTTKTAMMWDQMVKPRDRAFSPESYRWLKNKPTPPPDTTVRLARYVGTAADFIDMKHESLFVGAPPDREILDRAHADGYPLPIVIGQLVIEVTISRSSEPLLRPSQENTQDLFNKMFITVWPSVIRN